MAISRPPGQTGAHHHNGQWDGNDQAEHRGQPGEHSVLRMTSPEAGVGEERGVALDREDAPVLVQRPVDEALVEGRDDRSQHQHRQEGEHAVLHELVTPDAEGSAVAGRLVRVCWLAPR